MRKDSTAETTKLKQAISWPDYALAYDGLAYNQLTAMDWFTIPKIAGAKARDRKQSCRIG